MMPNPVGVSTPLNGSGWRTRLANPAAHCTAAHGALELGLRLIRYEFPNLGMPDRDLGWSLRPGAHGVLSGENLEGVFVKINSDGLRDCEHAILKPASTLRIAVLGDSLCQATEVKLEKTFWAILERELGDCMQCRGAKIEVINFGVAGYSTAQELIMLRTRLWKYRPDIVLLAFTGSDVIENSRKLSGHPLASYYLRDGDGLVLDQTFRRLIKYQRLRTWKAFLSQRLRFVQLAEQLYQRKSLESTGPDERFFCLPADLVWQDAWEVTEQLISMIHEEVGKHAGELWITTTSNDIQVHPDRKVREAFARKFGVSDLFYLERRIRSIAARAGIPVITPAKDMVRYAEENQIALHGFQGKVGYGHWNEAGHHLAGKLIASALSRELCTDWEQKYKDRCNLGVDRRNTRATGEFLINGGDPQAHGGGGAR